MCAAIALTMAATIAVAADAGDWSEPAFVLHRGDIVVTYRARLHGDRLVVEATHAPGWHTYAMDNRLRAQAATGKDHPETELSTRIRLEGATVAGPWRQTAPADLSTPEIHWFTWGFKGRAIFAAPVEAVDRGGIRVTVDAQACNASSCRMVDTIMLHVPPTDPTTDAAAPNLEELVVVTKENAPATKE